MVLTEEEARQKSCCGSDTCGRVVVHQASPSERMCIASQCMAWWWLGVNFGKPSETRVLKDGKPLGYCGLAGSFDKGSG